MGACYEEGDRGSYATTACPPPTATAMLLLLSLVMVSPLFNHGFHGEGEGLALEKGPEPVPKEFISLEHCRGCLFLTGVTVETRFEEYQSSYLERCYDASRFSGVLELSEGLSLRPGRADAHPTSRNHELNCFSVETDFQAQCINIAEVPFAFELKLEDQISSTKSFSATY